MKKMLNLFLVLFIPAVISAQDDNEYVHRYIGVGIRASVFQISELPVSIIPANRLLINIDPIKYARAEFHFGRYASTTEIPYSSFSGPAQIYKLDEVSTTVGGGIFGTYPAGKAKFIAGMRFSQNNYEEEDIDFDSFGNPYVVSNTGKIGIIAGVLGGEYYFSRWFSAGAEFSLVNMTDVYKPADPASQKLTTKTSITESSLVFRFYPY
jgi:hypothetical protein